VHFDPQKKLVFENDASDYGVGAVLSHRMQDGTERPVVQWPIRDTASSKQMTNI